MYIKIILTSISSIAITFLVITISFFNSNKISFGERINFQTKNGEFKFTAIPSKGIDYKMMERQFEEFKLKNNTINETTLYRTTTKNYLKISKWCQYKVMPEWQYPFIR